MPSPTSRSQQSPPCLASAEARSIVGARNTEFPVGPMAVQIVNSCTSWKPTGFSKNTSPEPSAFLAGPFDCGAGNSESFTTQLAVSERVPGEMYRELTKKCPSELEWHLALTWTDAYHEPVARIAPRKMSSVKQAARAVHRCCAAHEEKDRVPLNPERKTLIS
jgi:hypothetical protein